MVGEKSKVSVSDFIRLNKIFEDNGWREKFGNENVFERFMDMLENFSFDEKELIFELTTKYLWISFNEYQYLLIKTLELVEIEKLLNCTRIISFPIVDPKDIGKPKSSLFLLYLFKSICYLAKGYGHIEFKMIDNYKDFENEQFLNSDIIFLIDDFIGSGDTLRSTLKEIVKNNSIKKSQLNIITLATQSNMDDFDITCYTFNERTKGISDFYTPPTLEINIQLMKDIEKLIPNNKRFSFGYNGSEALVTMMRTPNNTFPIFWKNHKKGGKNFKAPFERR